MPRPKPPAPLVQFHVKLPPEEHAAIGDIVTAWHAEVTKTLAEQGIQAAPPADRTAWFRQVVKEQAARYGVPIGALQPPAAEKPKASAVSKPPAKRGTKPKR